MRTKTKQPRYFTHLTQEDRVVIEKGLDIGSSLKQMAQQIRKDPSTLSKEIAQYRVKHSTRDFTRTIKNQCVHRLNCHRQHVCLDRHCRRPCSSCIFCNERCPDFVFDACRSLTRFPHVCNGCSTKRHCYRDKYFYRSVLAQRKSHDRNVSARQGINLDESQLDELDSLVSPLVKKGQSLNHIFANLASEIPCSKRTLYRYVDLGLLSCRNLDFPRRVRYKKRRHLKRRPPTEQACREGRTYRDFLLFTGYQPDLPIAEMDTVHGRAGGQVLLTIILRASHLMLAFLLPACTQQAVLDVFNRLEQAMGLDLFQEIFPVILTDNGSEFKRPDVLENSSPGKPRTRIFFCDPMASWQKGCLEKNHEYLRYVLPKGSSFDLLTQDDVDLLLCHINSACRDSLRGDSPFEVASGSLPQELFESVYLRRIPFDQVLLIPDLLKK
jgi:IS30 family transposase